jgi:hypothetical protein
MAMMLKFWNWYQNSLSVHPVKTQVTTSGILWAVGDVTAQYITHSAAAAASSAKKRLQLSVTVSNNNNYHSQPTPFVLCCVALYLKIHTCRRRKKRMLNL